MTNNTPSTDNFQWDDQKVREFIEFGRRLHHISDIDYLGMDMEAFKASHANSVGGKDWEIVSFMGRSGSPIMGAGTQECGDEYMLKHPDLYSIHSVRRLSDGEVFSIKNKTTDGIIKNITIRPIKPQSTVEQCWIETDGGCGTDLMYAEKAPIPEEKPSVKPPIDNIDQLVEMEKAFNAARATNASIDIALGAPFLKYKSFMEYHKIKGGEGV